MVDPDILPIDQISPYEQAERNREDQIRQWCLMMADQYERHVLSAMPQGTMVDINAAHDPVRTVVRARMYHHFIIEGLAPQPNPDTSVLNSSHSKGKSRLQ